MLTKSERQQLKQLLSSPQWSAMNLLLTKMIEKYKDSFTSSDNEWETIRSLLINEGKVRALTELQQEMYNQIQSNE